LCMEHGSREQDTCQDNRGFANQFRNGHLFHLR
jgi:hypothetical protein